MKLYITEWITPESLYERKKKFISQGRKVKIHETKWSGGGSPLLLTKLEISMPKRDEFQNNLKSNYNE